MLKHSLRDLVVDCIEIAHDWTAAEIFPAHLSNTREYQTYLRAINLARGALEEAQRLVEATMAED